MSNKSFWGLILLLGVASVVIIAATAPSIRHGFQRLPITESKQATGVIRDVATYGTRIYSKVDSSVASNRDTFLTIGVPTGDAKNYYACVYIDTVDTNYAQDSCYIRWYTTMDRGYAGVTKILASDSFAIAGNQYRLSKLTGTDTTFWGETYLMIILRDSCNVAWMARDSTTNDKVKTRDYKVLVWFNKKD